MCGICGVVCDEPVAPMTEQQLAKMRDALLHRGPDDSGQYIANHIAMGSRRLSIIDLSPNGRMPMMTPDGRYCIVYNGEVYNYREFRSELEGKGHHFRSNSDTETLLYLYAEYGPRMLDRLIGMFAIAIWDAHESVLFLARDRLGVKPLVYHRQRERLLFASEEKALIAAGVQPVFDEDTWDELLYFRYVSGESTVFKGIRNLLPGHYMLWRSGDIRITRYWHLGERAELLRGTIREPIEWYRDTFESSIRYQLISDVPVGVLLSGGLDSSTVGAVSGKLNPQIASFTVRFDDPFHDEGLLAREVAAKYSLRSHALYVSPSRDLPKLLADASRLLDAPLAHGNDAHVLAIARYAKPHVTVLLSGEGGDETLGGYVRYRPLQISHPVLKVLQYMIPLWGSLLSKRSRLLKPRLRKLRRFLRQGNLDDFILFNSCDVLPIDLMDLGIQTRPPVFDYRRKMLSEAKRTYPGEPIRQAMYLDQHTFLQSLLNRNDRMTMGASIECRVPFLDHRLVEGVASLDTVAFLKRRESKALLRASFGARLPPSILSHRKVGFGAPWDAYMRDSNSLRSNVESLLQTSTAQGFPFPVRTLERLVKEFQSGDNRHMLLIRQLMMVDIWKQELGQYAQHFA